MKAKDLQKLNLNQLKDKEQDFKKELFNLRFQAIRGQLTNVSRIKDCRRDIARVKLILAEKQQVQR